MVIVSTNHSVFCYLVKCQLYLYCAVLCTANLQFLNHLGKSLLKYIEYGYVHENAIDRMYILTVVVEKTEKKKRIIILSERKKNSELKNKPLLI